MSTSSSARPIRPSTRSARVITVNARTSERDTGVLLVTDPLTRQVMDLFNVSYEVLLLMLQRFFAHTEETDAQLKALADATVNLMFQAIKPIGNLVTTLPAGPDYPGRAAGPSFELFYESDTLLPHREAAWILLTEHFATLGQIVEDVAGQPLVCYLCERIFQPLGMTSTDLLRSEAVTSRLATGYTLGSRGAKAVADRQWVTAAASSV